MSSNHTEKNDLTHVDEISLLIEQYGDLFDELVTAFYETDPMRLCAVGCPENEYDLEVKTILPRLPNAKSVHDVESIIFEEFGNWFGDSEVVGPRENYQSSAARVWKIWNDRNKQKAG